MQYQIEEMKELGIREIYIVIGYLGSLIKKTFGTGKKWGVKINYIKQKERLGIAHAVGQLEPFVKFPFLLYLGDIFYVSDHLKKMFTLFNNNKDNKSVLAVKKEENPELIKRNFSLILKKDGTVMRVIEKPRYVTNKLKGCGIYLFDLPIFDAIRNTPRTAMRDEYEITNSIQLLIDYGYKVGIAKVINWDANITFAADLLDCNLAQLKRMKKKNLIDSRARIKYPKLVSNSVIGAGVIIDRPVKISDSVIFPGVVINQKTPIIRTIVTSREKIKIKPSLK